MTHFVNAPDVIDLMAEAQALFDEPFWTDRDRHSRTLVTTPRMRITLTALRPGAELGSEGNDDTLAVQVLRGTVRLEFDGKAAPLAAGQLATMAEPARGASARTRTRSCC